MKYTIRLLAVSLACLALNGYAMDTAKPDVKTAAEKTNSEVVDPYATAHALFAAAATGQEYEAVIKAYDDDAANKAANENQKAIATTNKGEARLANGDVVGGFADRDARLACPQDARLFKPGVFVEVSNSLSAQADIRGKKVAVYCDEGGIGDIYFFARFMKVIKKKGRPLSALQQLRLYKKYLTL